jgi:hypothetical protein
MQSLRHPSILPYRIAFVGIDDNDPNDGAFVVSSPIDRAPLRVLASVNGMGWDHVSVSRYNRCPNWREMSFIKELFFLPHETAMQLHVPAADHVNYHPFCLHIWRPVDEEIPRPPNVLVGGAT